MAALLHPTTNFKHATKSMLPLTLQVVEEEAAKRIELLVKKRVEEELEKRKDEIEQEVAKRVEEAKRKMEKEMMEELERQREQQKREELARQVTAVFIYQLGVSAS